MKNANQETYRKYIRAIRSKSKGRLFCFQCDEQKIYSPLVHFKKDMTISVNDSSAVVQKVSAWHCMVCGDCIFDDGEGERWSAAMDALKKEVKGGEALELNRVLAERIEVARSPDAVWHDAEDVFAELEANLESNS